MGDGKWSDGLFTMRTRDIKCINLTSHVTVFQIEVVAIPTCAQIVVKMESNNERITRIQKCYPVMNGTESTRTKRRIS